MRFPIVLGIAGALLLVPALATAQDPEPPELAEMDIEELGRIPVTSASRRPEAVSNASAAIFVVTREDMRRAGSTSIPDALRLAPGLQVARVTARDWSITARGFAEQSPNKLLVLIDGRAVYSPLFSGVFWDIQSIPLDDVDRIEVILGPGATLWGSNAVNGVINVITRAATVTRGGRVTARAGTAEHLAGSVRYGFGLGASSALRVYGLFADREPSRFADGTAGEDDWRQGQGGFRFDGLVGRRNQVTVQGDAYTANGDQVARVASPDPPYTEVLPGERRVSGGNVLARWISVLGESSELQVKAYYDRAVRDQPPSTGRVDVDIADLELQHRFRPGNRHSVVWGGGYRMVSDELTETFTTALVPSTRTIHLVTAYAQDEIALVPERLFGTLGMKIEQNGLSGVEWQPNVRLQWMPGTRHTVWGSGARAVRIPSRLDTDIRFVAQVVPGTPTTVVRFEGNEEFRSEELISVDLGYRGELGRTVSADLSLFHGWYDGLRTTHPLAPYMEDGLRIQPVTIGNDSEGRSWGGTLAINWRPVSPVLVRASYSRLEMRVTADADAAPGSSLTVNPGFNPEHFGSVGAFVTLPSNLELHLLGRYFGELPSPLVDDYAELGARLGWHARPDLSIALRGENLLSARHPEFASAPQREMPRRAELHVEWRF